MTNEQIMDNIITGAQQVLEQYGYVSTYSAIRKIVTEWYKNKQPLITLFSKHKSWNPQKYFIHFDTPFARDVDAHAIHKFFEWVQPRCEYSKTLNNLFEYYDTFINEYMEYLIKEDYSELKIRSGLKTSKAMKRILLSLGFEKYPDFEREYAKYSDAVNPLEIIRHTVISLNPVDYLLMSNGNSWSSCHTIDVDNPNGYHGCNRSGTLSYMMDPSSIVVYQVDKEYDGNDLEIQPKVLRQMFHYQDGVLIQGRMYPQSYDGVNSQYTPIRAIKQKIIADCLDLPNLWLKKKGTDACEMYTHSDGAHYRDYLEREACSVSRIIDLIPENDPENDTRKVYIGHESYCIYCGDSFCSTNSLYCCKSCSSGNEEYECEECGSIINDSEVYWIDGEAYCEDCVRYCEDCETYHIASEVEYYEDLGK